jgi:acyl dehydratase
LDIAMPTTVATPADLLRLTGQELGVTDWIEVTQSDVDGFAAATGDHQWIHVDPERARSGPFGTTIAHGYLTLALLPPLFGRLLTVEKAGMGINYGLNRERFPAPLPVGSRVRLSASLVDAQPVAGGVQITIDATLQQDAATKPVCVAQAIYRYYDAAAL